MTDTNRRLTRTVGAGVAAIALVGLTACGGETPSMPNMPEIPGVGDPQQAFGDAHQKALGLAALGGAGMEQGVGQQVKDLAPQVQGEGQQLDQQLRGLASGIGVSLPDQVSPEVQSQVDDLKARSGEEFDQGWLQAAQTQVTELNDQAQGLLNVPGLPPEQLEQARAQVSNLGELKTKLDEAAAAGGAATPGGEPGEGGAADGGQGGEAGGQTGQDGAAGGQDGAGDGGQAAGPDGSGSEGSGSAGSGSEGSGSEDSGSEGAGQNGSGNAVDAGTGGQAASSDAVLPIALGGAGVLLLGAGLIRLRRSRA
ncbi:DUF4142 domain-containing protein [Pseudonocardia nantongensis]|uniref:DUF4142 domain-containing protein n=1 Tax=Pseudonocardia nantongensis TaxID=1181885 RepID=UPI003979E9DE